MISKLFARARSLWRGIHKRSELEAEMRDEFRTHVELRARDLEASGISPAAALRQARREFGSTERYKEEARASRGLRRIDELKFSWLDFRLGFRMLKRYPGLTLVGSVALAFAIWMGACTFELISQWMRPNIRLDDADQIVGIQLRNTAERQLYGRALHDFFAWRKEVKSVEELSAFRMLDRNLVVSGNFGSPVEVAEISASAFRVTRVPALLGRFLLESDEQPAAPPVLVIGYDLWQQRFGGAHDVLGHTVRLGNSHATIVGVMPRNFAFPAYHGVWTPLRINALTYGPAQGPEIKVFGRLADGVSLEDAQAELNHLGLRTAADFPDTHKHLRPEVVPYARSIVTLSPGEFMGLRWINLAVVLLIALVCGNVALLMFARAATRESEVVVRNALGASRSRIIMQLFAEALVLGAVGTVLGLAAAKYGLRWAILLLRENLGDLPYWVNSNLSTATVLYALLLTVLGASIAGIVPALRVTRGIGTTLRQAGAGGGGLKFSGLWTVVIVAQVALTVTFPVVALLIWRAGEPMRTFEFGFAPNQYVSAGLELDGENSAGEPADASHAAYLQRYQRTYQQLERRLSSEPTVEGVTFTSRLPGSYHYWRQIDVVEDVPVPRDSIIGQRVISVAVDADYFDVLGAKVVSGRGLRADDSASGRRVAVVNQSFVSLVLHGRNPIGRRLRFTNAQEWNASAPPGPWFEIVGVVQDLGMNYLNRENGEPGLYQPLTAAANEVHMIVKVRGDPAQFEPQLRAVTDIVEPGLRLYNILPMSQIDIGLSRMVGVYVRTSLLMSAIALLLSLAGIYAVMAFAVSRRTREIGIRVALGADARRVLLSVFRRPLAQIALGIVAGGLLVSALVQGMVGSLSLREIALIAAHAGLMTVVCLFACVVPTRRALRIQPTDALRQD